METTPTVSRQAVRRGGPTARAENGPPVASRKIWRVTYRRADWLPTAANSCRVFEDRAAAEAFMKRRCNAAAAGAVAWVKLEVAEVVGDWSPADER
jgi:hypothetical protein